MLTLAENDLQQTPWERVETVIEVSSQPPAQVEEGDDVMEDTQDETPTGGGFFTIPLMCLGIGLIAMCLLIPAAAEHRRLAYEPETLQLDLEQLKTQEATNAAFLARLASDATLSERLARRQMKMVPEGTTVLQLKSNEIRSDMSPFLLTTVPPPPPMPEYRPVGGVLSAACRHPKTQLYMIGAGMLMIASGLVLSRSSDPMREPELAEPSDS